MKGATCLPWTTAAPSRPKGFRPPGGSPGRPDAHPHCLHHLPPSGAKVVIQPADQQAATIQAIADQLQKMQPDAREFQVTAARGTEFDRQEMLRRTEAVRPPGPGPSHEEQPQATLRLPYPPPDFVSAPRRPPPYPTQGYGMPSHQHPTRTNQTTGPALATDLLPDSDETFQDFITPQFAFPCNSIGEEQLRKAGLDPKLLQQAADPASALRTDAHSSKQANLILRGVGLAVLATTGALPQKVSDNPPLTAQWPHKKVWLAKTGHWADYEDLSVEHFVPGYLEIILPTTAVARDHLLYLQTMMRDTASSSWHLVRSTHKQILLLVEHKQLKWEDTTNSNSIHAAQLLLAKEDALRDKLLGLPEKQASAKPAKRKTVKEEVGKPCPAYQTGACTHPMSHNLDRTNLLHVYNYCYKHGGHRFSHQEPSCQRKVNKSS